MNRLILIGNGFDLAHGLKTSTFSFISNYLISVLEEIRINNRYKDILLEISPFAENIRLVNSNAKISEKNALTTFRNLGRVNNTVYITYYSKLLQAIIIKLETLQWVDMESLYFDYLYKIIEDRYNINKDLIKYHAQFDFIKQKLFKYLSKEEEEFNAKGNKAYSDRILEYMIQEVSDENILVRYINKELKDFCIVNFNYTKTAEWYYSEIKKKYNAQLIYIHGELSGENGEPIYGFGDEHNDKYKQIENGKNTNFLRDIKSFQYLLKDNYNEMSRFIDSDEYQVYIFGHSCGVSDRTLLKQIFEHENCKSIQVFFHRENKDKNDFVSKSYEIARHFDNKLVFRNKLAPLTKSVHLPQANPNRNIKTEIEEI